MTKEEHVFQTYLRHITAYADDIAVFNEHTNNGTGAMEQANESFMRAIENIIDVPEQAADDFRKSILVYCGKLHVSRIEPCYANCPTDLCLAIRKYASSIA